MKKLMLVLILVSFSCSRAPKPKTETVVEYETDYFSDASEQRRTDENREKDNKQQRYDVLNAVTIAIITLMLVQY